MIIFNTLFLIFSVIPWPIKEFGEMHSVSSVMGDARGSVSRPRFHRGVDIAAAVGTEVYPIYSGYVQSSGKGGKNSSVTVYQYGPPYGLAMRYIHVEPKAPDGTWVKGIKMDEENPDKMAEVIDYPEPGGDHLHFDRYTPEVDDLKKGVWYNPLIVEDGFENYEDGNRTKVWKPDFFVSGSEGEIATSLDTILHGRVDIRAKCQDIKHGGSTGGIYKTKWLIRRKGSDLVYEPAESLFFNQLEPPHDYTNDVFLVHDRHKWVAPNSPFYYWVTNYIDENNEVVDAYWNTKLKKGEEGIEVDAENYEEAMFPDGRYRVWVMGYDVRGNEPDTTLDPPSGADYRDVILSNFLPELVSIFDAYKNGFSVIFSEEMQASACDRAQYDLESEYGEPVEIESIMQDLQYPNLYHFKTADDMKDMVYTLSTVWGIEDLTGNTLRTSKDFFGSSVEFSIRFMHLLDISRQTMSENLSVSQTRAPQAEENDIAEPGEMLAIKPTLLNRINEEVYFQSESLEVVTGYNVDIEKGKYDLDEWVSPGALVKPSEPFLAFIPDDYNASEIGFTLMTSGFSWSGEYGDTMDFFVPVGIKRTDISELWINDDDDIYQWNQENGWTDPEDSIHVYCELRNQDYIHPIHNVIINVALIGEEEKNKLKINNTRILFGKLEPYETKINPTPITIKAGPGWDPRDDVGLEISITYTYNNKNYWEINHHAIPGYKEKKGPPAEWLGAFSPNRDGFKDSLIVPFTTKEEYPIVEALKKDTLGRIFERDTTYRARAENLEIKLEKKLSSLKFKFKGPFEKGTHYDVTWRCFVLCNLLRDGIGEIYLYEPLSWWYRVRKQMVIQPFDAYDERIWLDTENEYFQPNSYIVQIDRIPAVVRNVKPDKHVFSASTDEVNINFNVSEPCSFWFRVYDVANKRWIKSSDTSYVEGENNITWYGTDENDNPVSSGFYNVCLYTQDLANPPQECEVQLQVNNNIPYLNILEPEWASAFRGDTTFDVQAEFYDPQGIAENSESLFVKKDIEGLNYTFYPSTIIEDRILYSSLNFPEGGRYILKVSVSDIHGNISESQRSFYIDNNPPEIKVAGPSDDSTFSNKMGNLAFALHFEDNLDSFLVFPKEKEIYVSIRNSWSSPFFSVKFIEPPIPYSTHILFLFFVVLP